MDQRQRPNFLSKYRRGLAQVCASLGATGAGSLLLDGFRKGPKPFRLFAATLLGTAAIASSLICEPLRAEEDGAALVAALRDRNMYDLALGYLQARAESPLVTDEFRQRIPYEQAMTLIEHSARTSDTTRRTEWLRAAEERLSRFAADNPNSDLGGEARVKLAQVLLERGRQVVLRAKQIPAGQEDRRKQLLESARVAFDQARTQFAGAQEYYNNARKQFPTNLDPRTEADKIERRDEYRLQWLTAWFYKARSSFEKAKAYPEGSPDFESLHEEAATELADLYEKYHTRLVGLTAHLYEGRAYQAVGDLDKAIGCFEDLVIQPDGPPEFRLLITQAWTGLAECLLAQEKYDELIQRCTSWIRGSTDDELRRPEWLAVRLLIARGKKLKAGTLDEGSPARNKLRREARDEFRLIARQPSPLRRDAQQEFASHTNRAADERAASDVKEFQEAYRTAIDAFDEKRVFADQASAAKDPDKASELADAADQSGQRAKAFFGRALALAPATTDLDLDQLNLARYYLAWLCYQDEEYYRAALLGEFLARRYPDSSPARDGAKLAMAAYQQLYRQAREEGAAGDNLDVDAGRMAAIADYVARRWPGTEDAALARDTLVSFAVREGRIEDAKAMLDSLDPQRRLQSELRVANGLWAEYLRARRDEQPESQPNDATAELGTEARRRLAAGFEEVAEAGVVSRVAATTALYLAQAKLLENDYAGAIEVLDAEKVGPLTLVRSGHPVASQPAFIAEVGKTALQAFTLASPPQQERAGQAMKLLEDAVEGMRDGAARLTQAYLGLGFQLRERLEALVAAGQDREAQQVAAAFNGLLERLAGSAAASDWTTRLWTALTYYEVGEALAATNRSSSVSTDYFEKSLAAYDQLLSTAASHPGFAPNERAVMAVRKRKADVLRGLERFSEAMDIYSALLGENVMMLDVQRDAAYTYQDWGESDARRFENAIYGGRRVRSTGENRVWGWIKLSKIAAQAAARNPQYRDWYFEARFNAAKARYRSALAVDGDERTSRLFKAKNAIRALYLSEPELGGADRKQDFEQLVMQIQQALKERPVGLQEFASG